MTEMQFNQLSPAEAERLALLAEECGEVIQAIGKILRHGYESTHPDGGPTNREALECELGDVRAAVVLMLRAGDLFDPNLESAARRKSARIGQWLHYDQPK